MKKHLLLGLRILLAAAGIAYIIWAVDWVDQVKYPAGTVGPNGQILADETVFKVSKGDYDPTDPEAVLTIQDPANGITGQVRVKDLDTDQHSPSFIPGILTMIGQADLRLLALALMVLTPIYPILMVRWWLLLRARGLTVTLWKAFRLTMVGNFFNFCMPGTTGGDLVKAYYAAKRSDRRADAVMTVIVDRVAGLLGLVILAGAAGLFMLSNDTARKVTIYIWLGAATFMFGAGVYFSRRLRTGLKIDRLLRKMPMQGVLKKIDQAAVAYRDHRRIVFGSILVSVPVHVCLSMSTAFSGFALGMDLPLGLLLTVVPVLFLVGAVPISPQGIGVMELLAMELLHQPPFATANQIVGMLLMIRLNQMFFSVFGALFLLKGDIHLHPVRDLDPDNAEQSPPEGAPSL